MRRWEWAALAAVTVLAAALRLIDLGSVSPDPFYDAAVRSMSKSFHNFFFGAFEPAGTVSIDKPPVDLWLQVASVKLLGFSSTTLKLPEAFAGIASVPLLFAAVRRMWNPPAALAAAVAMAVLPVEVITARSDTMDAVMMALTVLALLLLVLAAERGSTAWLLAGAAAMGLAFNVKLLESLVALPGLAVFAFIAMPGTTSRRLLRLGLAGAVYVAISLSWLTATLLVPAHERPYAIGSTNGSAWNAAFVFNGTDRLGGKSPEPQGTVYEPGHKYPTATQSERDHIPIVPPSPTRLLARIGPLSGQRLGMELLVGLLLGIPALLWGVLRPQEWDAEEGPGRIARARAPGAATAGPAPVGAAPSAPAAAANSGERRGGERQRSSSSGVAPPRLGGGAPDLDPAATARPGDTRSPASDAEAALRIRRGAAAGLALWTLCGIVLFSQMERLHPRYVEGFTPAVAAMMGIGVAWAATPRGRLRLGLLTVTLAIVVYYSERLLYGYIGVFWLALPAALGAFGCALAARSRRLPARLHAVLAPGAVAALTLVAALAVPFSADVTSIRTHVTDAGYVGALPGDVQGPLSAYLRAHQDGARFEVAALSSTQIGSLIVQDARPVLVLTTYSGRVFTSVPKLESLIAQGQVRYAFLNSFCGRHGGANNPACSAPAKWVRAHATDVSRQAGLPRRGVLYRLPGVAP